MAKYEKKLSELQSVRYTALYGDSRYFFIISNTRVREKNIFTLFLSLGFLSLSHAFSPPENQFFSFVAPHLSAQ